MSAGSRYQFRVQKTSGWAVASPASQRARLSGQGRSARPEAFAKCKPARRKQRVRRGRHRSLATEKTSTRDPYTSGSTGRVENSRDSRTVSCRLLSGRTSLCSETPVCREGREHLDGASPDLAVVHGANRFLRIPPIPARDASVSISKPCKRLFVWLLFLGF